jgi:hypothetical protein
MILIRFYFVYLNKKSVLNTWNVKSSWSMSFSMILNSEYNDNNPNDLN